MAEKDYLHALIDELPRSEISAALRYLEFLVERRDDPVAASLAAAVEDDEGIEGTELEALREALRDLEAGRLVPHAKVRAEALETL